MVDRNGGNRGIRNRECLSFTTVITLKKPSHASDRPGDLVILHALKKPLRGGLLFRAESSIHFCDIDRAATQEMPLFQQIQQQKFAVALVIKRVNDDCRVEEIS